MSDLDANQTDTDGDSASDDTEIAQSTDPLNAQKYTGKHGCGTKPRYIRFIHLRTLVAGVWMKRNEQAIVRKKGS
ncbi:MAG: thrombospondin type 3 repeat-containing protein [Nitrospinales bacterium]